LRGEPEFKEKIGMSANRRSGTLLLIVVIALGLSVTAGCARKKMSMKMTAAAGMGVCEYDPKDRSLFYGRVDDGDPCYRLIGRVHGDQEPPRRIIPEKGEPVEPGQSDESEQSQQPVQRVPPVPNGPFFEAGYQDLGETAFDGTWVGTGVPTPDEGIIKAKAWHAALGYSYPITRRFGVFGRVGYAFWDVEEDEDFGGVPLSNSASGEDLLFGGGLSFSLTRSLLLELEYSQFMDVGEKDVTGVADLDAATLSLFYRF
jgi:hypothetical protein